MTALPTAMLSINALDACKLRYCPFSVNTKHHFNIPAWQPQFQLIQHLTLYSNVLIGALGDKGAGKSVFLSELEAYLPSTILRSKIKATPDFDVHDLRQVLVDSFAINKSGLAKYNLATDFLRQLASRKQHCLLIIDDAHLLSNDVLAALMSWVDEQRTDVYLHFLLGGEPSLKDVFNLFATGEVANYLHCFTLSSMNLKEVESYLTARFEGAGFKGRLPFSAQVLTKIYKEAQGNMTRLHELAAFYLNERFTQTHKISHKFDFKSVIRTHKKHIASVTLGLFASLSALLLVQVIQPKKAVKPIAKSLPRPVLEKNILVNRRPTLKSAVRNTNLPESELASFDLDKMSPLEAHKKAMRVHKAPRHETDDLRRYDIGHSGPSEDVKLRALAEAKLNRKTFPVVLDKVVVLPSVDSTPALKPVLKPKRKPMHKVRAKGRKTTKLRLKRATNKKHQYTIQLIGSGNKTAVKQFVAQYQLKGRARILKLIRKNKPWYIIVMGQYKNRAKAHTALKQLPKGLRNLSPWIRKG